MRKERKIINTNIRLNLCEEQDRQAWEYLQTMDREKYKSYTRAVVVALNDYFSREYRNAADSYLETREKELCVRNIHRIFLPRLPRIG